MLYEIVLKLQFFVTLPVLLWHTKYRLGKIVASCEVEGRAMKAVERK